MRKTWAAFAAAIILAMSPHAPVRAQGAVQQSGVVTPGHVASWFQNGIIGDGGGGFGVSGQWTPIMALSTPGTSSFTYITQSGNFFCIGGNNGSLVFLDFDVKSVPTIGTGTGNVLMGNMPYPAADPNNTNGSPVFLLGTFSMLLSLPYFSSLDTPTALNFLTEFGASTSTISYAQITTGMSFEIGGTITYITASAC